MPAWPEASEATETPQDSEGNEADVNDDSPANTGSKPADICATADSSTGYRSAATTGLDDDTTPSTRTAASGTRIEDAIARQDEMTQSDRSVNAAKDNAGATAEERRQGDALPGMLAIGNGDDEGRVAGIKKGPPGLRRSASVAGPATLPLARTHDSNPEFLSGTAELLSSSSGEESSGEEFEEIQ